MNYLSQKCHYETGRRRHSLSFPQRKKKTEVMDPEEVTNLTGWVRLSLRRLENGPLPDRAAPVQGPGWQPKWGRESLIPEPSWARSPSLISRLFRVRSSDCPLTGSDSFPLVLALSLSPLVQAHSACWCTLLSRCAGHLSMQWLSVSKHTTGVLSRTP